MDYVFATQYLITKHTLHCFGQDYLKISQETSYLHRKTEAPHAKWDRNPQVEKDTVRHLIALTEEIKRKQF